MNFSFSIKFQTIFLPQDCKISEVFKDCMACRYLKCIRIGMSTSHMQVSKGGRKKVRVLVARPLRP